MGRSREPVLGPLLCGRVSHQLWVNNAPGDLSDTQHVEAMASGKACLVGTGGAVGLKARPMEYSPSQLFHGPRRGFCLLGSFTEMGNSEQG